MDAIDFDRLWLPWAHPVKELTVPAGGSETVTLTIPNPSKDRPMRVEVWVNVLEFQRDLEPPAPPQSREQ